MTAAHEHHDEEDEGEVDILGAGETYALDRAGRRAQRRQRRDARAARGSATDLDDEVTFVYEPSVRSMPPLRPYFRSLWECRAFATELARAKVKGSQSNTLLGGLWAILDPMFMVGIYYFVFTILREGSRPNTFLPSLISGILHWQVSAAALNQGATSVTGGKNLMLNSTFPRMLLPLSAIYGGILAFLPSVVVIFAALVLLDAEITFHLLWWGVLFVLQIGISLGLALIFSTAIVFVADVKNTLNYISRIMFFTSPIIFPLGFIPENIVNVIRWMPFFGVFANYQRIIAGQGLDATTALIAVGWAVGTVVLGVWLFLRYEREFASKLS